MQAIADIAEAAYIYGYPSVDLYNILYKYVEDKASPEYKAPFNTIYNTRRVGTPADKAIIAPNCDTPYSYAWLDLRAEPIVLSIPQFDAGRYVALMLDDLYTNIIDYVSPRTNGNVGGDFLVVGPGWTGSVPPGIKRVFHSPTQLTLAYYRTQLFNAADIEHVWKIQDQLGVQTLSHYLHAPPPPPAPAIQWIPPVLVREEAPSLRFFSVLNWMLQYMPVLEDEQSLREEFATIGIKPALGFDPVDAEQEAAILQGMQAGLKAMVDFLPGVKSSGELFGSRTFFGRRYINRAVGAMAGILGNSAEEYLGIGYHGDADNQPFDGSHCYEIKFTPATMPPVHAFWSITVYDASMWLYANPINRYVINSPMIDQLVHDADGGFTIYVQHAAPAGDKVANWLPVPAGKFNLTFRAYQPEAAILNFTYHAPPVIKVQ